MKLDGEVRVTFEDWEASVPQWIKGDSLWKVEAYRLALFLSHLAWKDAAGLLRDRRASVYVDQLLRATGHIGACVAEGYSRNTAKARAIYYEYALGSTRESRDWYFKCGPALKSRVLDHRLGLCASVIRLLFRMVNQERKENRPIVRAPRR